MLKSSLFDPLPKSNEKTKERVDGTNNFSAHCRKKGKNSSKGYLVSFGII